MQLRHRLYANLLVGGALLLLLVTNVYAASCARTCLERLPRAQPAQVHAPSTLSLAP